MKSISCSTNFGSHHVSTKIDFDQSPPEFTVDFRQKNDEHDQDVVGFNSSHLLSHQCDCPNSIQQSDLKAILKLQLEQRFPQRHDSLEFDWKQLGSKACIFADSTERLESFKQNNPIPQKFIQAEGLVRAFCEFEDLSSAFLLWWYDTTIEVIYVQNKTLFGLKQLYIDPSDCLISQKQEFYRSDLINCMKSINNDHSLPVFGFYTCEKSQDGFSSLEHSDLKIRRPSLEVAPYSSIVQGRDFLKTWPAIGLSLIHQHRESHLNLFEAKSETSSVPRSASKTSLHLALSAASLLLGIFAYFYSQYLKDLQTLESLQFSPELNIAISDHKQTQELKKNILSERPDLLQLIEDLSPKDIRGITLDQLNFKKGQVAKITGRTKNEMHFKYIEALKKNKNFNDVKLVSPKYDARKREYQFTITFEYKKWNSKKQKSPLYYAN